MVQQCRNNSDESEKKSQSYLWSAVGSDFNRLKFIALQSADQPRQDGSDCGERSLEETLKIRTKCQFTDFVQVTGWRRLSIPPAKCDREFTTDRKGKAKGVGRVALYGPKVRFVVGALHFRHASTIPLFLSHQTSIYIHTHAHIHTDTHPPGSMRKIS